MPAPRVDPFPAPDEYKALRARMTADRKGRADIEWSQSLKKPATPEEMALELCYVICNSGMKYTVVQVFWPKVRDALVTDGKIPPEIFKHPGKVAALEDIWRRRETLYGECMSTIDADLPAWCEQLAWIGGITKFHAAKNLGADVAKPDRWLVRLAQRSGESVDALCARVAAASGDRVATADLVLWWGCQCGAISIPPAGRPVLAAS